MWATWEAFNRTLRQSTAGPQMDPSETHVFVSYSHKDADIVVPIVSILRAVGAKAFRDADNIPPGKKWRLVIEESIDAASVMLVFWCEHAQKSMEVRREWMRALATQTDTIPIRLTDQQLDPELATLQAIDLRSLQVHRPTVELPVLHERTQAEKPQSSGWWNAFCRFLNDPFRQLGGEMRKSKSSLPKVENERLVKDVSKRMQEIADRIERERRHVISASNQIEAELRQRYGSSEGPY